MSIVLANNAHTTLAANISSTDTTIYVDDVDSFPPLGVDEYFYCTIESTTGTYEVVKVTQTNATNFIVTRAQEGTIAVPFNIGARVELRVTVQSLEDHFAATADAVVAPLIAAEIGVTLQAYDTDLTTWAGLTPSANAQSLVTAADYSAMRTLLGLGTMAVQDASAISVTGGTLTGLTQLRLTNNTYLTARNQAGAGDVDMWKVNTGNWLQQGAVRSWDNTNTHQDRGALIEQVRYDNLTPSTVHNLYYWLAVSENVGEGGVAGVGTLYSVCADAATVVDGRKPALYGAQFNVHPLINRNNTPNDDAVAAQFHNSGPGKATEIAYFGRGPSALASEAFCVIGVDTWADCLIGSTGHYTVGIDFARLGTSPAEVSNTFIKFPNNASMLKGRNAADTLDCDGLLLDSSDILRIGGTNTASIAFDSPVSVLNIENTDTTITRASAGNINIEGNLVYRAGGTDVPITDGGTGASTAAAAATALGVGTGNSPEFTAVNIGHASNTTLARIAAGRLSIAGVELARLGAAGTFTADQTFQTASTNTIMSVTGGSGYGMINLRGSGTNNAFFLLGNTSNGERVRMYADDSRTYGVSVDGGSTYGLTIDSGNNMTLAAPLRNKVYTVATLPAGTAGAQAYASDLRVFNGAGTQEGAAAGTGGMCTYNGSAWKIAGTNVTAVA